MGHKEFFFSSSHVSSNTRVDVTIGAGDQKNIKVFLNCIFKSIILSYITLQVTHVLDTLIITPVAVGGDILIYNSGANIFMGLNPLALNSMKS